MIWTSKHLQHKCITNSTTLIGLTKNPKDLDPKDTDAIYVAIIGGGPKGFYALERLLANLRKNVLHRKIIIHWFNNNASFGAGQNYSITQPNYLLINYCIGNINCWEEDDCISFVDDGADLKTWINQNSTSDYKAKDEDYASRELVGQYLMNAVYNVIHYEINNVEVHLIKATIDDLAEQSGVFTLHHADSRLPYQYKSILLATGHCYSNESLAIKKLTLDSKFQYFSFVYPIEKLNSIPANSKVAIKGLGLTFTDVILQLTEGRGGKFKEEHDELTYIPSGEECILYPFSRCNLPMMPRHPILPHTKYKLKFMHDNWIADLKSLNRKIDFYKDILPIFNKEIKFAYYHSFYKDLNLPDEQLWQLIEKEKSEHYLDLDRLINPNKYYHNEENESYQEYIVALCSYVMNEIKEGEQSNNLAASAGACREGLIQIAKLYNFDGFTSQSQQDFDRNWHSSLARLSYGPPMINAQKSYALLKAGIIQMPSQHTPEVELVEDKVLLSYRKTNIECDAFVDARIPRGSIKNGNNPLYKNLFERKIIQERYNGDYATDAIAIDKKGKLKDKAHWLFTLYGTPTEGNVLDNDSLSRKTYNYGNFWAVETANSIK